jgi:hypothetical protein
MTTIVPIERRSRNLLPSIADIIFLGVFFFLTLSGDQTLLGDADTGYHIRAGEFIIDHFSIPRADIFSFLTPPLQWTLHEWLAEVIMAQVHRIAGLNGIVILFSFLVALSFYLVFELLLKPRSNILFAAAMALLVALSSSSNWLARPHIFTFTLFVVWYYLLINYCRFRNRTYLLAMPPLMLLWVNLHGGFILALILLGIYLFGSLAHWYFASNSEKKQWLEKSRFLAMTLIACVFVALLNPYGYKTLLFPFRVVQDQFLMDHITEYLSPNFHFSAIRPFEILLLATIGIFGVSGIRLKIIEFTLVLLFGHMALYSSRHIPLFAIISGPIVLKQAHIAFEKIDGRFKAFVKRRLDSFTIIDRSTIPYFWPVTGMLIVATLATTGQISYDFDPKYVPVKAVEFIKRENIKGNMFNNDEFGDYIIYAGWPKYKVFIDGRTDMYGASRVNEYIKISQAEASWESIVEKYKITWILHDPNSTLSKVLLERNDWKLIYSDNVANIFVKTVPEYDDIIDKYRTTQPFTKENSFAK